MKAEDIMTRDVISTGPDATIFEAVRLMLQHRISGLPVVNGSGRLLGMVTEGDFLRRAEIGTERHRPRWLEFVLGPGRSAAEYTHSHGRKVEEIMSAEPYWVSEGTPVEDIVSLMERRRIKRVPVTRDARVVGIVSRANLVRAMLPMARAARQPAQGDADIRKRILAELEGQRWAPVALVTVTVQDGVVDLCGTILDERDRVALKVLAENIPGVKAVHEHLAFVEPMSGVVIDMDDDAKLATDVKNVA
ncbi:MAG TPA: CBS domain-containing protein [Pseudolabrys sp.]